MKQKADRLDWSKVPEPILSAWVHHLAELLHPEGNRDDPLAGIAKIAERSRSGDPEAYWALCGAGARAAETVEAQLRVAVGAARGKAGRPRNIERDEWIFRSVTKRLQRGQSMNDAYRFTANDLPKEFGTLSRDGVKTAYRRYVKRLPKPGDLFG